MTVIAQPSIANAGSDQTICATSTNLNATPPTTGTGTWSLVSGSGTPISPNSPTTLVNGLGAGTNLFQWTVSNGPCPPSIDFVAIIVDASPTTANAGPNQTVCQNTTVTMAANTPTTGNGIWTQVQGSSTIFSTNTPNTQVSNISVGINIYVWTVTNGTCPPSVDSVVITVNPLPNLNINPPIAQICIGNSIQLTASGAFSYVWSPATALSATNIANPIASPTTTITYFVTGTSTAGCSATSNITVFVSTPPTVTVSPTSTTACTNAPVALTASGATAYTWSPASGLSSTTGATVFASPTTNTTYMVIGNNGGCTDTAYVTVNSLPAPTASVAPTSSLICSGNNVVLTGSGGLGYTWTPTNDLSSTNTAVTTASPTTTTIYSVIAIAANGCRDTATTIVVVNQPPNVSVSPNALTICSGIGDTLTASGAFSFSWSPASGLNTTTGPVVIANPSTTTTYTVVGTTTGCGTSTSTVTVTVNAQPSVTVTPASITICFGGFTNLNASGATNYSWFPGTGLSSSTGQVVTANPTSSTTYTCVGTNSGGCNDTFIVNVNVNPQYTVSITPTPAGCGVANSGTAIAIPNGGSPPFTYQWNDPLNQTNDTAYFLAAGNYTVIVTDNAGCTQTQTVTITNNSNIALNVLNTMNLCFGDSTGTATVFPSGGVQPYTYSWSDSLRQTTNIADSLVSGTYTVIVTDAMGCTQSVSISVNQPIILRTNIVPNSAQCGNATGYAELEVTGGSPSYTYLWSNGQTSENLLNVDSGTYYVTVTDQNGCKARDTVMVGNTTTEYCVFIPNAFSPNGDGDHDVWFIEHLDYYGDVSVEVYNRWGNSVYETGAYKNDWDGMFKGKPLPGGVYFFVLNFGNGAREVKGTLTLLR
jgi:gliding motility-associated-like protein